MRGDRIAMRARDAIIIEEPALLAVHAQCPILTLHPKECVHRDDHGVILATRPA